MMKFYRHSVSALFTFFLLLSTGVFGQTTITGNVSDQNGLEIPGASILLKGTTQGTTTNFDGNFEISIENQENAIFTVKAVGFQPQDVSVNGRNNLIVTLKEDITELNEVVVTALGVKRKEKYSS